MKVETKDISPPITVEDIDKAPISLPQDVSANWQEKFNQLLNKFTEVAEENISLKEQNYNLKSKGKTDGIIDKLIIPASGFVSIIIILILICVFMAVFKNNGVYFPVLSDDIVKSLITLTSVIVPSMLASIVAAIFRGKTDHK